MIILTLFDFILIIHEFLYLIILGIWILLFKYEFLKSPNPLFAYISTLFNNIIIILYMIFNGTSFIIFISYLSYVMFFKVYSILSLIFDYNAKIDYISVLISILLIFITSIIISIFTMNSNN